MQVAVGRTWHPELSVAWIVAGLVLVFAMFWETTWSMVDLWLASGTYSHGFLILPTFVWLVWQRRLTLSRLPLCPLWLGLCALAGLGLLWLLGRLASANAPTQFALVAMVPAVVATVFGASWLRALGFPLAFLFFAVPVGDSLVPHMVDWTADVTVASLKLSGLPVYREGNYFSIPSGNWSVVEACSGIRYVFACLAVATLYAWSVYRSTARRILFTLGALAIAIAGNWIRAYGIVMLAHLSDNRLAAGVDHFIYGGVFFAVIMVVVLSLGTLWRENPEVGSITRTSGSTTTRSTSATNAASTPGRSLAAALAAAATLLVWPLVSVGTGGEAHSALAPLGDIAPAAGWHRVEEPVTMWEPHLRNPKQVLKQTFAKEGNRVSLHLGVFGRPTPDSKLTSSANQLVLLQDPNWRQIARGAAEVHRGGEMIAVTTGKLAWKKVRVVAWHLYWIDGKLTTSSAKAAWLQVLARLRGRSETSTWIVVYTTELNNMTSAAPVLETFLSDMLNSIDQALRAVDR